MSLDIINNLSLCGLKMAGAGFTRARVPSARHSQPVPGAGAAARTPRASAGSAAAGGQPVREELYLPSPLALTTSPLQISPRDQMLLPRVKPVHGSGIGAVSVWWPSARWGPC